MNYTIALNEQEVKLLLSILANTQGVSYSVMHPLIQKINTQVTNQLQATKGVSERISRGTEDSYYGTEKDQNGNSVGY